MTTPVREGEILAGKYRVDRVLGAGGMGVVVAAHHLQLDEKVALKFLLPSALGNQEAVARFAREARAAVKIKSEHVARVSDVGTLENGAPYIVMEYLEGSDLFAWIRDRGALSVPQALEFVLQACEAIAEAHALGIVHRDLKPANIFVIRRADGLLSVKVLDFGISKMTGLEGSGVDSSMTKTSALMGSPLYMSPEQMSSSKTVDARGDIWALGVILYELLTGALPFPGETMPELILQIMSASPTAMRPKLPSLPDGLESVILRCLEKDRSKRFQTVGELAVALLPFAPERSKSSVERISGVMRNAGYPASARSLPPSSAPPIEPENAAAGTVASWGKTLAGTGHGTRIAVVGVVAIGMLLVGLVVMRKPAAPEEGVGSAVAAPSVPPVPVPKAAPAPPAVNPAPSVADAPPIPIATTTSAVVVTPSATPKRDLPRRAARPHPASPTGTAASPPEPPPVSKAPAAAVYDDRK